MGMFIVLDQLADSNLIDMHGGNSIVKFWKVKRFWPEWWQAFLEFCMFVMLTKL
jgi:hypothetical protein